jgi:hypothetical protein
MIGGRNKTGKVGGFVEAVNFLRVGTEGITRKVYQL